MRKLGLIGGFAVIGLMASLGAAQAQFFNYSAVFTPNPFPSSGPDRLNITNQSSNSVFAGLFGSNVITTNLTTTSSAPDNSPATLDGDYDIAFTIVPSDNLGNPLTSSQTQHFSGHLNGTVSMDTANITNMFTSGTQSYNFGALGTFEVFLNSFTPPGAPGSTGLGAIAAHVNGTLARGPDPTPEFGSVFSLGGLLAAGGAGMWLKRRKKA